MYNLFIVASPLQLLNCIEARDYFKTKNNILIIIGTRKSKNFNQMIQLLKIYYWDKVTYFNLPVGLVEYFRYPHFTNQFIKDIITLNIENVFVGEYRSIHINHLVNLLDIRNIYLVDDGISTLSFDKYNKNISLKQITRNIVYQVLSYKIKKIKYIFFTCFHLENYETITNSYNYIKKYKSDVVTTNTVIFIGQPLVELSIVNKSYYKEYMKKIIHYFENKNFIYSLHRGNNINFIQELSKELGFKYLEFDNLIEFELLKSDTKPSVVATFYSTGIYTLNKIFNDIEYVTFRIEKKSIRKEFLPNIDIENYYNEFEKTNILVESL